jgi:hypothetical protein
VGLFALVLDEQGELVGCDAPDQALRPLLATEVMLVPVRSILLGARGDGCTELFPGVWLSRVGLATSAGALLGGILIFSPNAWLVPQVQQAAFQIGWDLPQLKLALEPHATGTRESATLAGTMLGASASDLALLQDRENVETAYSAHLTLAFDTIDLLYAVGKTIGTPLAPRRFMGDLCEKLFGALSFGWVCVAMSEDPILPSAVRNAVASKGQLPADERTLGRLMIDSAMLPLKGSRVCEEMPPLTSDAYPQVLVTTVDCRGRPVGVMAAGAKHGLDPMVSSYDSQLVDACSGFLSTFLENARLYEDQRDMFVGTVQAMTAAIDAKDAYTRGHSERVAHIAWQLAMASGMSPADAERLRVAGLVHDVGKIGVPEYILTKPGKLLEMEFAFIKKHPEIGFNVLRPVPQLADVLPAVLHHHERYDGKGYPHGLSGESIPVNARIIAVADSFDAMSSDRSYRSRMDRSRVIEEITRSAGTQLDPRFAKLMSSLDLAEYDRLSAVHKEMENPAPSRAAG